MTEQYPGAVPPSPNHPQTPPAAPYQGAPQHGGGFQAPYPNAPDQGPYQQNLQQPNPQYPNASYPGGPQPYQAPPQNGPYQQNTPFQGAPYQGVDDRERRRATRTIGIGAVFFVIGLLITVLTYSHASGSGGVYIVAWGPMLFGGIRVIIGLVLLAKSNR